MLYKLLVTITICLMSATLAGADTYTFEWDHNPPQDNVQYYRLWWRAYNPFEKLEWRGDQIHGPNEGFSCPDEEISTEFGVDVPCQSVGYTNTATIRDLPPDSLCFAVTANDDYNHESDFSNQVCVNKARFKIK